MPIACDTLKYLSISAPFNDRGATLEAICTSLQSPPAQIVPALALLREEGLISAQRHAGSATAASCMRYKITPSGMRYVKSISEGKTVALSDDLELPVRQSQKMAPRGSSTLGLLNSVAWLNPAPHKPAK